MCHWIRSESVMLAQEQGDLELQTQSMCVLWLKAEIACREGWCFHSLDQHSFFWSILQNFAGLRSCRVRSLFAESIGCYSLLLLWKGFYVLEVVKVSSLFKVLVKQEYFVSTVQNTGWNTLFYAFSMGRLGIFLWARLGDEHSLNSCSLVTSKLSSEIQ